MVLKEHLVVSLLPLLFLNVLSSLKKMHSGPPMIWQRTRLKVRNNRVKNDQGLDSLKKTHMQSQAQVGNAHTGYFGRLHFTELKKHQD